VNIIDPCSLLSILIICQFILLSDCHSGHVLNNEVRSAEVNEPLSRVKVGEELLEHANELLLAVLFVDEGLLVLDALEAGVEGLVAVLLAHVGGELVVVARGDVDHLFLVAGGGGVLVSETIGFRAHGALFSILVRRLRRLLRVEGLLGLSLLLGGLPVVVTGLGQVLNVLLVLVLEEFRILVEFLVALRGLVSSQVHLLHFLLSLKLLHLSALLGSHLVLLRLDRGLLLLLLVLLVDLLLGLDAFELFKDILVVQEGVGELISEVSSVEELADAGLNEGVAQDLVDGRSSSGVSLEHVLNQLVELRSEVARQFRVFTLDDLLGQLMEGLGVEGRLESGHLVEEDTERPDVGLKVVSFTLDDLRGQVVGGSYDGLGCRAGVREHTGDSEISELHNTAFSQENVLGLKITMENLLVVSVLDSKADLGENV